MSSYRSHLLYKGDPIYVLTITFKDGTGDSLVFTDESYWEEYEAYLVESAQSLGITSIASSMSLLNCNLQDIENIGDDS